MTLAWRWIPRKPPGMSRVSDGHRPDNTSRRLDLTAPSDFARLVEVMNHVLFEMTHRHYEYPQAEQWRDRFMDQVRRDGFRLDEEGQIVTDDQIDISDNLLATLEDRSSNPGSSTSTQPEY